MQSPYHSIAYHHEVGSELGMYSIDGKSLKNSDECDSDEE